ncbi:MAG: winged helix-turn-helix domain-containing protein [Methyloligellaceae bacterium]
MTQAHHVVVVSDEMDIHYMLRDFLAQHEFRVSSVDGGEALRRIVAKEPVDLVVLDIELPGEDGLSLARYLREHTEVGIVTLTVAEAALDRIVSLEAGADDCLARPVDLRELLARVKAVLRRLGGNGCYLPMSAGPRRAVKFGDYELDLTAHRLVSLDGQEIDLTSMEFLLLKTFAENPDRVLNRDELSELAYDRQWSPFDRSLDIRISRLRRKIERNPSKPQVIRTVRGVGYRFAAAA